MIANPIIYYSSSDMSSGSSKYSLTAIQASDGALFWRNASPIAIDVTQVVPEGDYLYLLTKSHSFLEVNTVESWEARSGSLLWRRRMEGLGSGRLLVSEGVIYVACFAPYGILALSASDGSLLWGHGFDQDVIQCTSSHQVLYLALRSEAGSDEQGAIAALRATDGALLWYQPTDHEVTALAVNDEHLYTALSVKTSRDTSLALDALKASDGGRAWRHSVRGARISDLTGVSSAWLIYHLVRSDGTSLAISGGHSEDVITALNPVDGTLLWEYVESDLGPIVIADEKIYAPSASGVTVLDVGTGQLLKKYRADKPVRKILVSTEAIYTVAEDTAISLKALRASDGSTLWQNQLDSSEAIGCLAIGAPTLRDVQGKMAGERLQGKEIDPMLAEANKILVHQLFTDVLSKGNVSLADQLLASNYNAHREGYLPELPAGLEGFKQLMALFHEAFPDGRFENLIIQNHYSEADLIATKYIWRGTNLGGIMGRPPNGNDFTYSGESLVHIIGGKIAEIWQSFDRFAAYVLEELMGRVQ